MIDGGDLFWKTGSLADNEHDQRALKAEVQARAFMLRGLDAFVPGEGDLALGVETFQRITTQHGMPVLAGNLSCGEVTWPLTRTVERGGRSVGIIGVVGVPGEGCELTEPPRDAAARGVAELGEVDLVVLISHSTSAEDQAIGREVAGIDFLLNGHSRQSWSHPRALDGGGWHLGSGSRGKKLGWLRLEFVEGAETWVDAGGVEVLREEEARLLERRELATSQVAGAASPDDAARYQTRVDYYEGELERVRAEIELQKSTADGLSHSFTNQLVPLDDKYEGHAETDPLVEATKAAITALGPKEYSSEPPEGPFVGSQSCRACHTEQWEQWSGTAHAHAYDTLVKENRHLDADCYSCHVTGAGLGGPTTPHAVGSLKNVGCESCHGPGQEHLGAAAKGYIMNPPAQAICTHCHDGEQDGGRFDFDSYLPKVAH